MSGRASKLLDIFFSGVRDGAAARWGGYQRRATTLTHTGRLGSAGAVRTREHDARALRGPRAITRAAYKLRGSIHLSLVTACGTRQRRTHASGTPLNSFPLCSILGFNRRLRLALRRDANRARDINNRPESSNRSYRWLVRELRETGKVARAFSLRVPWRAPYIKMASIAAWHPLPEASAEFPSAPSGTRRPRHTPFPPQR